VDNPLDLSGKTILVTGASAGIGRSTAVLLSRLGARVVLTGRNGQGLEETVSQMNGSCHRIAPLDLAKVNEIPAWLAELVGAVGLLDGLVHCAGTGPMVPLRFLSLEQLEEVMRVNFYSAVVLTKEFTRKRMHQPVASIVFVASVAGMLGTPARTAYSASKGALIAFAKSAAMELSKSGIRVNCVAPAYVETNMFEKSAASLTPEQLTTLVETTQPLGLGTPLDVANAIAFLLADTGKWITGSVLAVDGGYSAQ
jgi:NAD(P)-dependent dehydrogenase (short-subunit alcohol dehydrogenase family)